MKKTLSIFFAIAMVCSLAACGNSAPDNTSTPAASSVEPPAVSAPDSNADTDTTPKVGDGYVSYESQDIGLRLEYPEDWIVLSADIFNKPETLAYAEELTGMSPELMSEALEQTHFFLYNFTESTETFIANLNLMVSDSDGATYANYASKDTLAQLKELLDAEYTQMFDSFEWIAGPAAEEVGDNSYITMRFSYVLSGEEILGVLVMAVEGGLMYNFTYMVAMEKTSDTTFQVLDDLFASAEFLD